MYPFFIFLNDEQGDCSISSCNVTLCYIFGAKGILHLLKSFPYLNLIRLSLGLCL